MCCKGLIGAKASLPTTLTQTVHCGVQGMYYACLLALLPIGLCHFACAASLLFAVWIVCEGHTCAPVPLPSVSWCNCDSCTHRSSLSASFARWGRGRWHCANRGGAMCSILRISVVDVWEVWGVFPHVDSIVITR